MIAEVLIDIPHWHLDRTFDYVVPGTLVDAVKPGQRVEVPFGPRVLSGYVTGLKTSSGLERLKEIRSVLDLRPPLDQERLSLADTLSRRHLHPRVRYLSAMLPRALSMRTRVWLIPRDCSALPEELREFFPTKKPVPYEGALKTKSRLVHQALSDGLLEQDVRLRQTEYAKTVDYIRLKKHPESLRGSKQQALVDILAEHDEPIEKAELLKAADASHDSLSRLMRQEVVESFSKERYREQQTLYALEDTDVTLTETQQQVFDVIASRLDVFQTYLLHGVASSGKTEIYLELSARVLNAGRQVVVLLPEISLTPKITARFKARFGSTVAVYHSGLTVGEQYDEWRRMQRGEAQLVVGARSAVFAPFEDIGLFVFDEEHSDTYIQSEAPPYDAKDVASRRARTHRCPVLLGSATPSTESYHLAREGYYEYLRLRQRALFSREPKLRLIDMKQEFKDGNTSMFSRDLQKAIQSRLDRQEQTLLLLNRRGHAQFVLCRACGHVVKCPDCDISLTYHRHSDRLVCHHCSHAQPMTKQCPSCKSPHIRFMGVGTERVETALREWFPEASILRMDRDTTQRKQAHEEILHRFETEGDVLIGTQMIAKGLDFEKVTLVGVLSADMGLHVPSFYAESETFSLLMQIAGRSGRRDTRGDVLIQTYQKHHPVLQMVLDRDTKRFYERDLRFRRLSRVPPFARLSQVLLAAEDDRVAYRRALKTKQKLSMFDVLGPTQPFIRKQGGYLRWSLIVRHEDADALAEALSDIQAGMDPKSERLSLNHYPRIF